MKQAALLTKLRNDWVAVHGDDLDINARLWAMAQEFAEVKQGIRDQDGETTSVSYKQQASELGISSSMVSEYARTWRTYGDAWQDGGEDGGPLAFHAARREACGIDSGERYHRDQVATTRRVLREYPDEVWPEVLELAEERGYVLVVQAQAQPEAEPEPIREAEPEPVWEPEPAPVFSAVEPTEAMEEDEAVEEVEKAEVMPPAEEDEEAPYVAETTPDEPAEPAETAVPLEIIAASEIEPEPELSDEEREAQEQQRKAAEQQRESRAAERDALIASGYVARLIKSRAGVATKKMDIAFDEGVLTAHGREQFIGHVGAIEDGLAVFNESQVMQQERRRQERKLRAVAE